MSTTTTKKGTAAQLLASLQMPAEQKVETSSSAAKKLAPVVEPVAAVPKIQKRDTPVEPINNLPEAVSQKFSISLFGKDVEALQKISGLLFQAGSPAIPSQAVKVALRFAAKHLTAEQVRSLHQEIKGEDGRRRS